MPPSSPTVVSEFPDVVPAHPLDILPRVAPEPFSLESLMRSWPYDSHRFTDFRLYRTDTDTRKLRLTARPHITHAHTLEHKCYVLKAPLLFPLHLILTPPLIPGIHPHLPLLLFLTSPMLFPPTLLIFFHALPQSLLA